MLLPKELICPKNSIPHVNVRMAARVTGTVMPARLITERTGPVQIAEKTEIQIKTSLKKESNSKCPF